MTPTAITSATPTATTSRRATSRPGAAAAAFLVAAAAATAGTVHVDAASPAGGDGSRERPFLTIADASRLLRGGDVCVVRPGVYRETIAAADRVTYRGGRGVVVSGCDVVGDWDRTGPIWAAAVADPVRQLFAGVRRLPKARFPDEGDTPYDTAAWAEVVVERGRPSDTGSGRVTFPGGLEGRKFVGGFFTGISGRNPFQANMGRVAAADGDTLRCDRTNLRWYRSRPGEFDGPGRGYITDHIDALDAPGEWHWQNGTLHLMPLPEWGDSPPILEARTRLYGLDARGRRNVRVEDIAFRAAAADLREAEDCVVDHCEFTHVSPWGGHFDRRKNGDPEHYSYGCPVDGTSGVLIGGRGNVLSSSRLTCGWGALVTLRGEDNKVRNCVLEDANWQCREFAVNLILTGERHRVLNNTLRTSTAMLIALIDADRVPHRGNRIEGNDLRDYGRVMRDGGTAAVYANGNDDLGGTVIAGNRIADNRTTHHRVSSGIYLDDGSENWTVRDNLIDGGGRVRCGLFTHRGTGRMTILDNTFRSQTQAGWLSAVWEGKREAETIDFRGNASTAPAFAAMGVPADIDPDGNRGNLPAAELTPPPASRSHGAAEPVGVR